MLESRRNPKFESYTDSDIKRMYEEVDNKRKELILDYDQGKVTDADLDAIDHELLFLLDDEIYARGF